MAPLVPAPSAHLGIGPPTSPTDGAVRACPPRVTSPLSLPTSPAISAALARCMYADMPMHDQEEQVARHHAQQAHFPFLYSSSPPVCVLALRWPSLAPSRPRLSLSFAPCSLLSACLFSRVSLFHVLRPAPCPARCMTLHQALSPLCGSVISSPSQSGPCLQLAARGTPVVRRRRGILSQLPVLHVRVSAPVCVGHP